MLLPLKGGFYQARNVIANAQRCLNLYPEPNPEDSEAPTTHYLTPGLTQLSACPLPAQGRGLYRATNGRLFAVVGNSLYYIDPGWTWHILGQLRTKQGTVYMVDNGKTLVLVDGSNDGWQVDLADNSFTQITDPNFVGGTRCDYVDTFLLFNQPGTQDFYSSLSNEVTFDPLYFASKTGFPDKLITLVVVQRNIWLIGDLTTEVWYNAGNAGFPFAITPGVFIEHGCVAPYSIAKYDNFCFWLSNDRDGKAFVMEGGGYVARRISTFAIESELASYASVSDAIGMTYQQNGHVFYVLSFPTANRTWVYDRTTSMWHERASYNPAGTEENMWRLSATAFPYGQNVGLDYSTGALCLIDPSSSLDLNNPIIRRRGFPSLTTDGKRARFLRFTADVDSGNDQIQDDPAINQLFLRFSDDGGHSWSNPLGKPLGSLGDFLNQPEWRRLGVSRRRVFELFWSTPAVTALNGAYVDREPLLS